MSLNATLLNAISGINTAQRSLSLTAHNVANTNTEGYSRKVVQQESQVLAGRGAGARVAELVRYTDQFLTAQLRQQSSTAASTEVVSDFHQQIQTSIGAPGDDRDIATQLAEFAAAIDGMANSPETEAQALTAVNQAESLALAIEDLATAIQDRRRDADREIGFVVNQINDDLETIAELNTEIHRLTVSGGDATELLDQRDIMVRRLAEKIDVSTYVRESGQIVIQTDTGRALLDGSPSKLVYTPAAVVDRSVSFDALQVYRPEQLDDEGAPLVPGSGVTLVSAGVRSELSPELQNDAVADASQIIDNTLTGGRLKGLYDVRDQILPALDDQLLELAEGLRFAANAGHNTGNAVPPLTALEGSRTDLSDFAGATRSGTATIAVVDQSDLSTVTAFEVDVGAAASTADIVTAINTGLGALGTAAITADGNLEITLASTTQGLAINEGDSSIAFADGAGRTRDYGFSHYFGLNDFFTLKRNEPTALQVRPDLRSSPGRMSTAMLDVTTTPLTATLGGRGDNRAAQTFAEAIRGDVDVLARGGLSAGTTDLLTYAGDILGNLAVSASRAELTAERDADLRNQIELRAADISGVNLDEEMTRLIEFQKAYTVSARIMSVTEELYDELFRIAG